MVGAGVGAIIGHQTHHTAAGAAIGGGFGLVCLRRLETEPFGRLETEPPLGEPSYDFGVLFCKAGGASPPALRDCPGFSRCLIL